MAITKLSQLVRLNEPQSIKSLTNRNFETFGNGHILSVNDLMEISFKRYTGNLKDFNTNYYSVAATVEDLIYAIAGKIQSPTNKKVSGALPSPLLYNSTYVSRYNAGDRLFFIDKNDTLRVIKRTAVGATTEPTNDNILEAGRSDNPDNLPWEYESAPFDKYVIPIFSSIRTISKIDNPGYWVESIPYTLVDGITYGGAFDILSSDFYNGTHLTGGNGIEGEEAPIISVPASAVTLNNVVRTTPLTSLVVNSAPLTAVNNNNVSAYYNKTSDRYILNICHGNIDEVQNTLKTIGKAFNLSATSANFVFPFFTIATLTAENINPGASAYIGLPYSRSDVTLDNTSKAIPGLSATSYLGSNNTTINTHLYYFIGNSINPDNITLDLAIAARTVGYKEDRLSSNTLTITRPNYMTEGYILTGYTEGGVVTANVPLDQLSTSIELQVDTNNSPLYWKDKTLSLKTGLGLQNVAVETAKILQYDRNSTSSIVTQKSTTGRVSITVNTLTPISAELFKGIYKTNLYGTTVNNTDGLVYADSISLDKLYFTASEITNVDSDISVCISSVTEGGETKNVLTSFVADATVPASVKYVGVLSSDNKVTYALTDLSVLRVGGDGIYRISSYNWDKDKGQFACSINCGGVVSSFYIEPSQKPIVIDDVKRFHNTPLDISYTVGKDLYNAYIDEVNQANVIANLKLYVEQEIDRRIKEVIALVVSQNNRLYRILYGPLPLDS